MHVILSKAWRYVLFPALFYLAWFVALSFPAILSFGSHIWTGPGDGMAIYWNIWWVDKAVRELHQHPWFTDYLFHPMGTSLLVHTMHPLKGLMAIPLLKMLSPVQTYNTLVILSFMLTGVGAFWLAYALAKSYWASILAGFIFTFCSYHFAHAQGHLHLISLEWIPVFVLLWYFLLEKPSVRLGVSAAAVLFLVFLCDAYYMMYCVIFAALMVAWWCFRERSLLFLLRPEYRLPFVSFFVICMCTSGVLAGAILHGMSSDPPHYFAASDHSMDLLAPFIPGYHWRFASLTEAYWSKIPGKLHGNSLYIGWSVVVLMFFAFLRRRHEKHRDLMMWYLIALFFSVMALGPKLFVWGWEAPYIGDPDYRLIKMPYAFMQKFIPGLKVGARPNRLFIMAILAISMIAAFGIRQLWASGRTYRKLVPLLLVIMLIEYLPSPLPAAEPRPLEYIARLAEVEGEGAVFDLLTPRALGMYYQTIHERPIPVAWISRVGRSRKLQTAELEKLWKQGQYATIRDQYAYRFILDDAKRLEAILVSCGGGTILYEDAELVLVDVGSPLAAGDTTRTKEEVE